MITTITAPRSIKCNDKDNKNCFYFVEVIDRNAIICIMTFEQFKSLHNVIQPSN